MSISYSTIKEISQTDNMATLLSEQELKPVLQSVRVKSVKTKQGRRFEEPRVLWSVDEAELELAGGLEARHLFWTKAFLDDRDCAEYQSRVARLLSQNGNPL